MKIQQRVKDVTFHTLNDFLSVSIGLQLLAFCHWF